MVLAQLEIWHSRPIAPTRRIALGHLVLPADPVPGFGGVLLGGVLATHAEALDEDETVDVRRLLGEVAREERVVQPRLRHRFQVDRHGLMVSTHRLDRDGDALRFDIATTGHAMHHVLGAVYAVERLDQRVRPQLAQLLERALSWRGPLGVPFVSFMAGTRSYVSAVADPRAWALDVLGFPGGTLKVTKKDVMSRYRQSMRDAHPDHGGDSATAHRLMDDITEARRVLLESL